jgi:GxxExxY protein
MDYDTVGGLICASLGHVPVVGEKIIHTQDLSFEITGLLFKTHNELGRFCREKQYGDFFEALLKKENISYTREKELPRNGIQNLYTNKVDFVIEGKMLVDFKAKPLITRSHLNKNG